MTDTAGKPRKILAVDDEEDFEPMVRQRMRRDIRAGRYEFVFASNGVEALERLDVLVRPRERAALAADVAAMRERVRSERGSGGRWSVRYMRGGLLDVEFIAQFLQLLHAAEAPEVLAGDSVSVFEAAGARGLVDADAARELAEAAALWRNLEGVIRAAVGARAEGEEAEGAIENLLARSSGKAVLGALVESMRDTAERVARRFDETVAAQAA